jgi:hypothetical protein
MIQYSVSDYYDIYNQDFPTDGISSGWIQWKGTDVCVDLHCECGYHGHVDAEFFYRYECVGCGRKFAVGQNIKLIELTPEQAAGREFLSGTIDQ